MDDLLANKMVEKAFTEKDSSRLQALVARCDKAIQTHNARLAADLAALSEISISDTGVPLVLPFLKFQSQLPLAKRRHYAMSTQRHSHSTSERRGCPLTGGVARPSETSRQSKLLPRDLRNSRSRLSVAGCPAATSCRHSAFRAHLFAQGRILLEQA